MIERNMQNPTYKIFRPICMRALKGKVYLLEYGRSTEKLIHGVFHPPPTSNSAHLEFRSLMVRVIHSLLHLKKIMNQNLFPLTSALQTSFQEMTKNTFTALDWIFSRQPRLWKN